ncbi:hypothetical protein P5673_017897 [Acropora cervicornis]|uniref:Uncharacterized protein n=1 Tax=Acropora cervicornis TaxID=6130 RepID=A0AAD9QDH8_ACRCE|nr:hypothetical protein P5673_017897 [Acropora cervicornis]
MPHKMSIPTQEQSSIQQANSGKVKELHYLQPQRIVCEKYIATDPKQWDTSQPTRTRQMYSQRIGHQRQMVEWVILLGKRGSELAH